MPDGGQFFDLRSFANRIRQGDLKPQSAVLAGLKTAALFGYTTRTYLHLRSDAANKQGNDPLMGPKTMTDFCAGLLKRMNFSCRVTGDYPPEVRVRKEDGKPRGRLIVCNHRTHLDVPVVGSLITSFMVGSAMVRSWPVLGPGGELAGILYVDRSSPESRKETQRLVSNKLAAGFNVLNFPEGANFAGPGMAPFKPGLFRLVAGKEVDILPLVLRYPPNAGVEWVADDPEAAAKGELQDVVRRLSFLEHFIDLMTGPPLTIRAHFGPLLGCEAHLDPIQLMDHVRTDMLTDLEKLSP